MPAPTPAVPLSAFAWFFPSVIGLPLNGGTGAASAIVPRTRLFAEQHFVAAASPLCSGLRVCLPPGSLLPLQVPLQGSGGVYVRAERASLPLHASDMLSARLQAIGGARTLTSQDSQHCRLLLLQGCYAQGSLSSILLENVGSLGR